MRRTFAVLILATGALLATSGIAHAQFTEQIDGYEVSIELRTDGSLRITEVIDYDFGVSEHHGIFRDVPTRVHYDDTYDRVYPLTVESVNASGGASADYTTEQDGSLTRIKIGDPDETISGEHTYTIVYTIASLSVLVVRSAPDTIKAFVNSCLHRGRLIRDDGGPAFELRCPFHGYCWNLDGSLKQIPAEWDFPQVDRDEFHLPELRVGTWGGFVFVNFDPECRPLEDHVGELDAHFERWPLERRFKQAHVAKILRCNWKVAQEAFMEAFHVVATHPQLLAGIGDANSQYDVFGTFSRAITPNGTPSPHLSWAPTEQEMFDAMTDRRLDEPPAFELAEGMTARQAAAAGARMSLAPVIGAEAAEELSDAELVDSF